MFRNYFFALLDWWRRTMILAEKQTAIIFKEREIWWCSVGINVGVEIYGKGGKFTRPVLIFKKFNRQSFLGIPCTSQPKEGVWYVPISHGGQEMRAILSQIRVFDSKRLTKRVGTLSDEYFLETRKIFLELYST